MGSLRNNLPWLHLAYTGTVVAIAIGVTLAINGAAEAQTFPSKALRIIVPFPPGGAADITARILAENMTKGLGQPVIVENRPGAGSALGSELAARAPADGHTILEVFPSFVINPTLRRSLAYDPFKDFKAVGQTMSLPMAIAVHPSVPSKSLKELIALARARPGDLAYGSSGAGTLLHIFGEMLKFSLNVNITHVPYQGGAQQITAAAGGHVAIAVTNVTDIAPFATIGKVRVLAVTTAERTEALPNVPSVREAGYPQLEMTNWAGFVVPSATPSSSIVRLNTDLVRALRDTNVQEKFKAQGTVPTSGTPEQFAALLQSESARYAKVVQQAGIKLD